MDWLRSPMEMNWQRESEQRTQLKPLLHGDTRTHFCKCKLYFSLEHGNIIWDAVLGLFWKYLYVLAWLCCKLFGTSLYWLFLETCLVHYLYIDLSICVVCLVYCRLCVVGGTVCFNREVAWLFLAWRGRRTSADPSNSQHIRLRSRTTWGSAIESQ